MVYARAAQRVVGPAVVIALVALVLIGAWPGYDAHAYWAVDLGSVYTRDVSHPDAFLYSPVAAVFFEPFGALPFRAWLAGWVALLGAVLYSLTGPWIAAVVLLVPVSSELRNGNIHVLLAAAVVASFRYPAAWAFPLLTKPTLGIGLAWYAARGEWRKLAVAAGLTAALAGASFALTPQLWLDWTARLLSNVTPVVPDNATIPVPLLARLPVATALVVWGARTDRYWTLPVAACLALPVLWIPGLTLAIAGVVALLRAQDPNAGTRATVPQQHPSPLSPGSTPFG